MNTALGPPGKEQAPGLASEGSSKNNITDTPTITDDGDRTRDVVTYQVGYGTGYGIGYAHGRRDENDEWQTLLGVYRTAVRTPPARRPRGGAATVR